MPGAAAVPDVPLDVASPVPLDQDLAHVFSVEGEGEDEGEDEGEENGEQGGTAARPRKRRIATQGEVEAYIDTHAGARKMTPLEMAQFLATRSQRRRKVFEASRKAALAAEAASTARPAAGVVLSEQQRAVWGIFNSVFAAMMQYDQTSTASNAG